MQAQGNSNAGETMQAPKTKLKDDLESLKTDASRVMNDIGQLTKRMQDAGTSKTKELSDDVGKKISDEIAMLRDKVDGLEVEMKKYVGAIDQNVRSNPYVYILTSLGLGFLAGKLIAPRT